MEDESQAVDFAGQLVGGANDGPSQCVRPEVVGIPAGFADGVDNVGYASATQPAVYPIGGLATAVVVADTPVGTDVEVTIIPAAGRFLEIEKEWYELGPRGSLPAGMLRHCHQLKNGSGSATTFKVRTRVFNTGIAPAAVKKGDFKIKVAVHKEGPGAKKGKKKRRG